MHSGKFLFLIICVYQIGVSVRTHSVEYLDDKNIRISDEVAAQRLALLRKQMSLYEVDAYIITTSDVHQNEYIAERDERRSWLSGFTGSAGTAVVTLENAALWTDSRYYEAAALQLSDDWILMKSGISSTPKLQVWLTTLLPAGTKVGVDPEITTNSQWTSWSMALGASNVSLVALEDNLIDIIWEDQPAYSTGPIFEHPIQFAGLYNTKNTNLPAMYTELEHYLHIVMVTACSSQISFSSKFRAAEGHWRLKSNTCCVANPTRGSFRVSYGLDSPKWFAMPTSGLQLSRIILKQRFPQDIQGMTREEKLIKTRAAMVDAGVDLYVITALDEVAWLTNLRGSDIPHSPVFRSYILITNETATIYIPSPHSRLDETLAAELAGGDTTSFIIAEYENFWTDLKAAGELATVILLPAPFSYALGISQKVYNTVPSSKVKLATSPVLLFKDRKTEIEANGLRNAHLKDAVALCQFLARLEAAVKSSEEYDELRVVKELSALRSTQEYSFGDSFDTIAGYGPNSALPHYIPTEETNTVIGTDSILMLDSGGQYYDGTTDVTRSMHYGTPTKEQRISYTAILAGCIDLARLIFPVGSSYTTTDLLMRSHLYRLGRNYGHGSTHGIGHFLLIHEAWNTTYDVNFFGSQEPGYYQEGSWGMRLENIVVVVPANTTYTPDDTYLTFETVTLVPYARNLIDETKLNNDQLSWLNDYHATIRLKVGAELLRQGHNVTYDWLVKQTAPIVRQQSIYRRMNMVAIP